MALRIDGNQRYSLMKNRRSLFVNSTRPRTFRRDSSLQLVASRYAILSLDQTDEVIGTQNGQQTLDQRESRPLIVEIPRDRCRYRCAGRLARFISSDSTRLQDRDNLRTRGELSMSRLKLASLPACDKLGLGLFEDRDPNPAACGRRQGSNRCYAPPMTGVTSSSLAFAVRPLAALRLSMMHDLRRWQSYGGYSGEPFGCDKQALRRPRWATRCHSE